MRTGHHESPQWFAATLPNTYATCKRVNSTFVYLHHIQYIVLHIYIFIYMTCTYLYIYIYGEKERLYICIHEWNICTHILKLQKRNQFWPPSMEVTFNSLPNLNEGWIGPLCGERLPHVDREASGSCGDRAGGVPKHISRWLLILFWRCGLCSFVYICIYIYIYVCTVYTEIYPMFTGFGQSSIHYFHRPH